MSKRATHSSAVRERYKEQNRVQRMGSDMYPPIPYNNNGYNPNYEEYEEDWNNESRYNYSYPKPTNNRRNGGRKNSRQSVLSLTRIVVDWHLMSVNGDDVFVPVFTDMFYTEKFGGRGYIQTWEQWGDMGFPLRIDYMEYRGRVIPRYNKIVQDLTDAESGIRDELIAIVNEHFFTKTAPLKRNWFKWLFFASLILYFIIIVKMLGVI